MIASRAFVVFAVAIVAFAIAMLAAGVATVSFEMPWKGIATLAVVAVLVAWQRLRG